MADISKCTGIGCTMKETCYRFKAKADEYYQAYFSEPPHDGMDEDGNTKCEYYWLRDKIQQRVKININIDK